jgi:hypothetical protein
MEKEVYAYNKSPISQHKHFQHLFSTEDTATKNKFLKERVATTGRGWVQKSFGPSRTQNFVEKKLEKFW